MGELSSDDKRLVIAVMLVAVMVFSGFYMLLQAAYRPGKESTMGWEYSHIPRLGEVTPPSVPSTLYPSTRVNSLINSAGFWDGKKDIRGFSEGDYQITKIAMDRSSAHPNRKISYIDWHTDIKYHADHWAWLAYATLYTQDGTDIVVWRLDPSDPNAVFGLWVLSGWLHFDPDEPFTWSYWWVQNLFDDHIWFKARNEWGAGSIGFGPSGTYCVVIVQHMWRADPYDITLHEEVMAKFTSRPFMI